MHLVWLRDTHEWSWREMKSTRTSLDGTWVDWAHTDLYWLSIEKINQHNQPSQSIKPCNPAPLFFLKPCGFKLKTIKRLLAREKTNEQVMVSLILNLIGREDGVTIMNHSQKCTNFNSRTHPVFSTFQIAFSSIQYQNYRNFSCFPRMSDYIKLLFCPCLFRSELGNSFLLHGFGWRAFVEWNSV